MREPVRSKNTGFPQNDYRKYAKMPGEDKKLRTAVTDSPECDNRSEGGT
jgi:hypothetical protein